MALQVIRTQNLSAHTRMRHPIRGHNWDFLDPPALCGQLLEWTGTTGCAGSPERTGLGAISLFNG